MVTKMEKTEERNDREIVMANKKVVMSVLDKKLMKHIQILMTRKVQRG